MCQNRNTIVASINRQEWLQTHTPGRLSQDEVERATSEFNAAVEKLEVLCEALKRIDPTLNLKTKVPLASIVTFDVAPEHVNDLLALILVHPVVARAICESICFATAEKR